jgi:hypothetical protein
MSKQLQPKKDDSLLLAFRLSWDYEHPLMFICNTKDTVASVIQKIEGVVNHEKDVGNRYSSFKLDVKTTRMNPIHTLAQYIHLLQDYIPIIMVTGEKKVELLEKRVDKLENRVSNLEKLKKRISNVEEKAMPARNVRKLFTQERKALVDKSVEKAMPAKSVAKKASKAREVAMAAAATFFICEGEPERKMGPVDYCEDEELEGIVQSALGRAFSACDKPVPIAIRWEHGLPKWRDLNPGLVFYNEKCPNEKCPSYDAKTHPANVGLVNVNFQFTKFTLGTTQVVCPACETVFAEPKHPSVFQCFYKWQGKRAKSEQLIESNGWLASRDTNQVLGLFTETEAGANGVDLVPPSLNAPPRVLWTSFSIETKPL